MSRSDKQITNMIYDHTVAKNKLEELWKASPGSFNATEAAKHVDRIIKPTFSRALFQQPSSSTTMQPPHTTYKH